MRRILPSGLRQRLMLLIAFTVGASMLLVFAGALRERRAALGAAGAEASLLARLAAAHEERALTDAHRVLSGLAAGSGVDIATLRRVAMIAEWTRAGLFEHAGYLPVDRLPNQDGPPKMRLIA
jgi:hypothetical protein